MRLIDWVASSDTAACRFPSRELVAPIFIVRTGIGAEHFFARVDTDDNSVAYLAVGQLLDSYGTESDVDPIGFQEAH